METVHDQLTYGTERKPLPPIAYFLSYIFLVALPSQVSGLGLGRTGERGTCIYRKDPQGSRATISGKKNMHTKNKAKMDVEDTYPYVPSCTQVEQAALRLYRLRFP